MTMFRLGLQWLHLLQREPERHLWSGIWPADYKMAVRTYTCLLVRSGWLSNSMPQLLQVPLMLQAVLPRLLAAPQLHPVLQT